MKAAGIIPARFASTRFPGKPLALIHGKSMIERVYSRALKASSLSEVVVATDDQRIVDHVRGFGGKVLMTNANHPSGTDRCAEVAAILGTDFDLFVNVQGDEPYIHPGQIDLLVSCFKQPEIQIATLVKQITGQADLDNVNIPKVVRDLSGRALYFSRSAIPFAKPGERNGFISENCFFKHIGIYGFRNQTLKALAQLPHGMLEKCESLEQLRWLEAGYIIQTALSDHDNYAVDVPGDIPFIENLFAAD
jgi:3-deoxy-manno-octulosonate cytidylyltransferase (CMP-KDO synthetase)